MVIFVVRLRLTTKITSRGFFFLCFLGGAKRLPKTHFSRKTLKYTRVGFSEEKQGEGAEEELGERF